MRLLLLALASFSVTRADRSEDFHRKLLELSRDFLDLRGAAGGLDTTRDGEPAPRRRLQQSPAPQNQCLTTYVMEGLEECKAESEQRLTAQDARLDAQDARLNDFETKLDEFTLKLEDLIGNSGSNARWAPLTAAQIRSTSCSSVRGSVSSSVTDDYFGADGGIPGTLRCDLTLAEGFTKVRGSFTVRSLGHPDDNHSISSWGQNGKLHSGYFAFGTPSDIIMSGGVFGGDVKGDKLVSVTETAVNCGAGTCKTLRWEGDQEGAAEETWQWRDLQNLQVHYDSGVSGSGGWSPVTSQQISTASCSSVRGSISSTVSGDVIKATGGIPGTLRCDIGLSPFNAVRGSYAIRTTSSEHPDDNHTISSWGGRGGGSTGYFAFGTPGNIINKGGEGGGDVRGGTFARTVPQTSVDCGGGQCSILRFEGDQEGAAAETWEWTNFALEVYYL